MRESLCVLLNAMSDMKNCTMLILLQSLVCFLKDIIMVTFVCRYLASLRGHVSAVYQVRGVVYKASLGLLVCPT